MTADDLNKKPCLSAKCLAKAAAVVVVVAGLGAGGYVLLSGKDDVRDATPAAVTDAVAQVEGAESEVIQTPSGDIVQGNPVVAKVGGTEILRSEVLEFITALPENMRAQPLESLYPMALEQVINNKIVSEKAAQANLEQDEEVAKTMEMAKEQVIRSVYVQREVAKAVTEDKLKAEYDTLVKQLPPVDEVKARHILVDSEEKAKELIVKLDGGADFETLSRENSTGQTAENGGDLGYFGKGDMIPEFSDVAFSLAKGAYSKTPVQTQFGWHVIKVEDKRNRPVPAFDDVKPQVEAKLRQDELVRLIKDWQDQKKVERFDINGKPMTDAAPAQPQ